MRCNILEGEPCMYMCVYLCGFVALLQFPFQFCFLSVHVMSPATNQPADLTNIPFLPAAIILSYSGMQTSVPGSQHKLFL